MGEGRGEGEGEVQVGVQGFPQSKVEQQVGRLQQKVQLVKLNTEAVHSG